MIGNLSKSKTLRGEKGDPGNDGYSPKVTVTDIDNGHKVSIQDAFGLHIFELKNGDKGEDGVSPIVNVTTTEEGQKIVITDKEGKKEFVIKNTETNPDWSQNDETAPDYVKNRTHYIEPGIEYMHKEFTLEDTSSETGNSDVIVYLDYPLEEGVEYAYETNYGSGTFVATKNGYMFGNELDIDLGEYTGFYVISRQQAIFDVGYDVEGYIKITGLVYRPLDEKYIPQSIARVADVEEILDELHAYAQNLIGGES